MKKLMAIMLVIAIILSMAACTKEKKSDPSQWPELKVDIAPAADMHAQGDVILL